jgi:hypothetical protein
MKTITINGKPVEISAQEERAIRTVKYFDYAGSKGDFVEGRGRYKRFILPSGDRAKLFGISEVYKDHYADPSRIPPRAVAYFARHPRRSVCVVGDARRINNLCKKLDEAKI